MVQRDLRRVAGDLEGLVLSDGGACYEVPTLVIERYRVPVEDLTFLAGSETRGDDRQQPLVWTVIGAIYVPGEPTLADGAE